MAKPKDVLRLVTSSGQKVRVDDKPATADLRAGAALLQIVGDVLLPEGVVNPSVKPKDECVHTVQSGEFLVSWA